MLLEVIIISMPIIAFTIYTFLSYNILPAEYDDKFVRRLYYLFAIVWIIIVLFLYNEKIAGLEIIHLKNDNSNGQVFVNFGTVILIYLFTVTIWDYLFISCRSFKHIKFKDFELTTDEVKKVEYYNKYKEKEVNTLNSIISAKIGVIKFINNYIDTDLLNEHSYLDIIREYSKIRGRIKINVFYENGNMINNMYSKLKISPEELSSILYSINLLGVCSYKYSEGTHWLFARINTKYARDDLIVVLKGNLIVDEEYLILVDLINYYELKVDLVMYNIEN